MARSQVRRRARVSCEMSATAGNRCCSATGAPCRRAAASPSTSPAGTKTISAGRCKTPARSERRVARPRAHPSSGSDADGDRVRIVKVYLTSTPRLQRERLAQVACRQADALARDARGSAAREAPSARRAHGRAVHQGDGSARARWHVIDGADEAKRLLSAPHCC